MSYTRPWKSFSDQLEVLKSRSMSITDDRAALSYLERIGYYRLSAYWYPFRIFNYQIPEGKKWPVAVRTDNFVPNTCFTDAVELYLFDKKLRILTLDALERIEVAVRVDIAHLLGSRSTFAHLDPNQLHPTFANRKAGGNSGQTSHERWKDRYEGLIARSREDFVKHYHEKHGPDLPIWVAIETWDFGTTSQLFGMMKVPDQEVIARKYGVEDWRVFGSWLRSLNYLRNLAAHHSRLWNRNVIDQPKLPDRGRIPWCDEFISDPERLAKPFLLLAITRHLVRVICPGTEWHTRVKSHLNAFPKLHSDRRLSIEDTGTTPDWQKWWEN